MVVRIREEAARVAALVDLYLPPHKLSHRRARLARTRLQKKSELRFDEILYITILKPNNAQNDCCSGCSSPCKYRNRRRAFSAKIGDPACNSDELKEIIAQYVNNDVSDSKRLIQ